MYHHIPGLERIQGFDLEPIRIVLVNVVGFHPTKRPGVAHA
jgi:hypothetical protein